MELEAHRVDCQEDLPLCQKLPVSLSPSPFCSPSCSLRPSAFFPFLWDFLLRLLFLLLLLRLLLLILLPLFLFGTLVTAFEAFQSWVGTVAVRFEAFL